MVKHGFEPQDSNCRRSRTTGSDCSKWPNEQCDNLGINNRQVQRAQNAKAAAEGRAVYVRGLPPDWDSTHVEELFSSCGTLQSINLLPRKSEQRAGAAFLNFATSSEAECAVCAYDEHIVEGTGNSHFWLGCSLKTDFRGKVNVICADYTAPSEILIGFLFIGSCENARSECELQRSGISHVLSVLPNNFENAASYKEIEHLVLYAEDHTDVDLTVHFDQACSFLEMIRNAEGRVLVHCVAGRSRSVTLILAYLMRHRNLSLNEAFRILKERRPCALPNPGFWRQLQSEELKLFGVLSPTPLQYQRLGADAFGQNQACHAQGDAVPLPQLLGQTSLNNDSEICPVKTTSFSNAALRDRASNKTLSVQLPRGVLAKALPPLLIDLQKDLLQLSGRYGRVAGTFFAMKDHDCICSSGHWQPGMQGQVTACRTELSQILNFYGFGKVHWSLSWTLAANHIAGQPEIPV